MNKRKVLIISSLAVLFVAALTIGTVAYFSKTFTSDNNIATAASFDVDVVNSEGQSIGDEQFDLGDNLYPGMETNEAYTFQINKNNTDLPVEYTVNLSPSGDLFPANGDSPIILTLQRNIDNEWVDIDFENAFQLVNDVESFRVLVDWPHGDNDIDFQGMSGNVKLEVVATQVDGNSAEDARTMLNDAETALKALDLVHNDSSFNRGNFSKAESDAVQGLLDDAAEYINGLTSGKEELQAELDRLQQALDEKVESRYVYYEIVEDYTNFTQIQLKMSADHSGQVTRINVPKPQIIAAVHREGEKFWSMKYFTPSSSEIGDVFIYQLRFNGNVKNIDVKYTNLGGGNWGIESDWLVEKK